MQLFSITSYTAWKRLLLSTMHAKDKLQVPLQLHLMGNCTGRIIIYNFHVWGGLLIEFDNNIATEPAPSAFTL